MGADPKPRFPFPVPNGWFAVAWSDELAPFRSEQGAAQVLDAYCAHLGCGGRVSGSASAP